MFISKKRHDLVVEAYERRIAALELEAREWRRAFADEARTAIDAEGALETALAATRVALANADAETAAADAALARYVTDYAPRALEPLP